MPKFGKLILILGPSGAGKGTVLRFLKKQHSEFVFPISCTTREKRPNEKDGEVYYFITVDEFKNRIGNDDFLEYANVHGDNYYGTLKQPILEALNNGKTVIREVDVQGVRAIRELLPKEQVVTIFLNAKWNDLGARIKKRAPISDRELQARYQSFLKEMEWQNECSYIVESIEGKILQQCEAVEKIILSEIDR